MRDPFWSSNYGCQSTTSRILLADRARRLHRVRTKMLEMPRVWHPIAPKTKKFTLHIISLAVRKVRDGHHWTLHTWQRAMQILVGRHRLLHQVDRSRTLDRCTVLSPNVDQSQSQRLSQIQHIVGPLEESKEGSQQTDRLRRRQGEASPK